MAYLGDRRGAVSTYPPCASVLERELGIAPDRATRQAFDRLMAGPGSAPEGARRAQIGPAIGRSGTAPARLVGRSREFCVLGEVLRGRLGGRGGPGGAPAGAGGGEPRPVTQGAAR